MLVIRKKVKARTSKQSTSKLSMEKSLPILAVIISVISALFSYMQYRTSSLQVGLNEQQLRPHVTYVPTFFRTKRSLDIDMYLQNQSPLPANVIYTDLIASIGSDFVSYNYHSLNPDFIYQDKGGISTLPHIIEPQLALIEKDDKPLRVATCIIYASTANSDSRRWRFEAIHEYIPGSSLPKRLLIQEVEVTPSVKTCSAKVLQTPKSSHGSARVGRMSTALSAE